MKISNLSQLFVRIGADTSEFQKSMNNLQGSMKNLGQNMTRAGGTMTKFVTGPIVGASAALGKLAVDTGNYADRILDLQSATGLATDTIQEYEAIAQRAGVNTEVLTDASQQLTKAMARGEEGSANMNRGLEELGLSFEEINNASPDERMNMIVSELQNMEDPTRRAVVGQQLLKGSYDELAPVLDMSAEEMERVVEQAHESGKIMSGDALNSADDFRKGLDELKQELSGMGRSIATDFIPILNEKLIPAIQDSVIPALRSMAETIGGLLESFLNLPGPIQKLIGGLGILLAAAGPVLVIVGQLISALSVIAPLLGSLGPILAVVKGAFLVFAGALSAPVVAIGLVIAAIVLFRDEIWAALKFVLDFAIGFGSDMFDMMKDLASNLISAISGLPKEFLETGKSIMISLADGIKGLVSNVIKILGDLASNALNTISSLPKKFYEIGKNKISSLAKGIKGLVSNVIKILGDLASNALSTISGLPKKFYETAKNMISSFVKGIKDMAMAPIRAAKNLGASVVSALKKKIGMSSPAKEFIKIGEAMGEGVDVGLEGTQRYLESTSANTGVVAMSGVGSVAGSGSGGTNYNITQNVKVDSKEKLDEKGVRKETEKSMKDLALEYKGG